MVAPSTPRDVIGLLAAAVRDPDPVIFFEHKSLYATKGEVPDGEIVDTLGTAKILRPGKDATILALALMVPRALEAAERLKAEHGIDCEVVDVRSLVPLDTQTILGSVGQAPTACLPWRRTHVYAAGAPRSCRSSPTRRSTISTARRCASRRRTFRCPPPTRWKTPCCRRWTASPRRCGARCKAEEPTMAMYDNLLANVPTDLWIGGKWRKASDGARFDVIDPATENKIASVASASVDDAKAAIDAAQGAFDGWAARSRASAPRSCARPSS